MASLPARAATAGMPPAWLRDNCRCANCLDPVTWPAAGAAGPLARRSWPRYLADPGYRRACLQAILDYGLVLSGGAPTAPGTVLSIAGSMGFVRETNYGRLFDVRVEASPANLACTSPPIAPHTDSPYRDPVPTVQLLHCLRSAAAGGDSVFADGFRAAARLREQDPAAFSILATTPVTFSYRAPGTRMSATRPLIGLDPAGRIRETRFSSRSQGCYAGLDGVESAVAVSRHEQQEGKDRT